MLHNDKEKKLDPYDYDDVTDISESLSEINLLKVKPNIQKESENLNTEKKFKKVSTMNNLKMTRNDVDPNQDDEEVSLIQENDPILTNEEETLVEALDDDVEEIQADEMIPGDENDNLGFQLSHGNETLGFQLTPDAENHNLGFQLSPSAGNENLFSQLTPDADIEDFDSQASPSPAPLLAGPLPKLALSDPDNQFPDNSDDISFNIADEQMDEEDGEQLGDETFKHHDARSTMGPMEGPHAMPMPGAESPGADDDDDDDDDDDVQAPLPEGSYDPSEYDHLDVPPELKELFTYISNYTPQNIELEHKIRTFIPDYIPAVGDIDAFIKIPRPDDDPSTIGLTVLDEPSAKQSDSTVLDLQLRAVAKHTTARAVVVKTVENAEKNSKVIEKWMRDISDLHRAKPPPTVHYAKQMPDIDSLMQEWPGEIEELLKDINLPSAALQVELPHYVDLICSILDIPVYKSRIQSLHVFFTLYSVFKNSANFRHLADENIMENEPDSGGAERLVLNN